MERPELLPCPFCESANLSIIRAISPYGRQVRCSGCETEGPHGRTDGKAAELWNRAPRPQFLELTTKRPPGKTLKCDGCGAESKNLCGQCSASICDGCLIQDGKRTCVLCPTEEKGAEGR